MNTPLLAPGISIKKCTPPLKLNDFKLIAFDMDSTLITIECIDEIADMIGKKDQVSALTESAMRGEMMDYKESLTRRVALLKDASQTDLERVYNERLEITPGANSLIHACQANGLKVLLVSGGFTLFSTRVKNRLGIDFARANELEVEHTTGEGRLTGRLVAQPWGTICDGEEKRRTVLELASLMGIEPSECIAVGDGANDLPMMRAVGLSVAYHAKPIVSQEAQVAIHQGGLDRLLEVFSLSSVLALNAQV